LILKYDAEPATPNFPALPPASAMEIFFVALSDFKDSVLDFIFTPVLIVDVVVSLYKISRYEPPILPFPPPAPIPFNPNIPERFKL
jgi:hypothetical protein